MARHMGPFFAMLSPTDFVKTTHGVLPATSVQLFVKQLFSCSG